MALTATIISWIAIQKARKEIRGEAVRSLMERDL
jgi:hypothetical protein